MSTTPRLTAVLSLATTEAEYTVITQATVRGPQETTVRVLSPVTGPATPHIAVRVGPTLILVQDREALLSFTRAWRQAEELAATFLPD